MKKKMYFDFLLNIVANLIFTVSSQIVVYPIISKNISEASFGTLLTVMGISNAIGVIFGGSLSQIRLLSKGKYTFEENESFNFLFLMTIFFSFITSNFIYFFFLGEIDKISFLMLLVLTSFIAIRSYLVVYYRINLNFKMIFLHMIMTSLGYIFGLIVFIFFIKTWVIVFLIGEIISFLFLYYTTNWKSEFNFNFKFSKKVGLDYFQLITSSSVYSMMTYVDRLLIYPFLGASQVAIYYAASLVGKLAGIVLLPLSNVILSYLSSEENKDGWKIFKILFFFSFFLGLLALITSILLSPFLIRILYPNLMNSIENVYIFASFAAIISAVAALLQPALMRYCPLWYQTFIQSIYAVSYVGFSIPLMNVWGLKGFAYGNLIASLIRYLLVVGIGIYYLKIKNIEKEFK
ncbi:hypothetical protein ACWOFR_13185 [Carnobacterium gallinarum]|uniref:hypothetical protein n=1 Tax=Carnobacterium gallinarum TaxID=2749 RepID=UPI0005530541|nr:hypothetical protein [Carnobacterium gallinarum]